MSAKVLPDPNAIVPQGTILSVDKIVSQIELCKIDTFSNTIPNHDSSLSSIPLPRKQLKIDIESVNQTIRSDDSVVTSNDALMSTRSEIEGINSTFSREIEASGMLENGKVTVDIDKALDRVTALSKNDGKKTDEEKKEAVDFWNKRKLVKVAKWYHLVGLAASLILSASLNQWNAALQNGASSFLIGLVLQAIAFQCFSMCLAEMVSGLPFSGGSYGFVRATIGQAPGMFIGIIESAEYILATTVNVCQTTAILQIIFETDSNYNIIWDVCIFILSTSIQVTGGKFYWNSVFVTAGATITCLLLYFLSTVQYLPSIGSNTTLSWPVPTITSFMQAIPNSIVYFVGIEGLPLASEETFEPKTQVPSGIRNGMLVVNSITVLVFLTAVSAPQPNLFAEPWPLTPGYAVAWGLDLTYSNYRWLLVLALIPMFAATYSTIFCYGRQIFSMSRSGLLPSFLSLTTEEGGTTYVSMIFGSIVGTLICFVYRLAPKSDLTFAAMSNTLLIAALFNYLFQIAAYVVIRTKFEMLARAYENPLGLYGAGYSFVVFLFSLIGLIGWSENIWIALVALFCWTSIGMAYYFLVSVKNLNLSPEEQASMFMLYSLKFAQNRQKKISMAGSYVSDAEYNAALALRSTPKAGRTPLSSIHPN